MSIAASQRCTVEVRAKGITAPSSFSEVNRLREYDEMCKDAHQKASIRR